MCVCVCVCLCVCVCVCVRACVCVCVCQGFCRATSSLVIPGYWVKALLMARLASIGLASQSVPYSFRDEQKTAAFKTKLTTKSKSYAFLHAKGKTRLACWSVQSANSLSSQSFKLRQIVRTMFDKRIDLLALSLSHAGGVMALLQCSLTPFFTRALTLHILVELPLSYLPVLE